MTKVTDEVKSLFRKVRTSLGAPVRKVELEDDQLCDLLDICMEDYAERVGNWKIDTQWITLYGKTVNAKDIAYALSTRTLDMTKDYSYWFSKQVGLQQEGPWELKKDFVTIEKGKQVYVIPAGRVINKVMYVNPSTTQAALFANYGGIDIGFGGGYAQLGGGAYGPVGGFYTAPAADVAYLSTDINYKNRLLRSDLVYKVTAGPNGTHLLHLMSTPGSKLTFSMSNGSAGALSLIGCEVWYTYYDVSSSDDENECMLAHADDVILSPDQVPLAQLDFAFLNDPTKAIIRQLLVAKAKTTLGWVRGKFQGKVSVPEAEMAMEYQMLFQQGNEEWKATMDRLDKRLEALKPVNIMKENAELMQQNHEIQKLTPLGIYVI